MTPEQIAAEIEVMRTRRVLPSQELMDLAIERDWLPRRIQNAAANAGPGAGPGPRASRWFDEMLEILEYRFGHNFGDQGNRSN